MKYTFFALDKQRKRMGAPLSNWTSKMQLEPIEEIREKLETGGIDVSPEEVVIGPGGLLTYKGEQVLLHIREEERKFHFMDCRTLKTMRQWGRYERYVVASRIDGLFLIHKHTWLSRKPVEDWVPLKVCMNCLHEINWRGYAGAWYPERVKIRDEFDISDFFAEYATIFHSLPRRKDTAPPDYYVPEWSRISLQYREEQNWICENCDINLQAHKKLLHCHHKNGVPSDNQKENLQALCLICHSEQPLHHRVKRLITPEKRALIEKLRLEKENSSIVVQTEVRT